jgi:hypothetical protein
VGDDLLEVRLPYWKDPAFVLQGARRVRAWVCSPQLRKDPAHYGLEISTRLVVIPGGIDLVMMPE